MAYSRGCTTFAIVLLIVGGGAGVMAFIACAGLAFLGGVADDRQVQREGAQEVANVVRPADRPVERPASTIQKSPFNVSELCGLNIDGVRRKLGSPANAQNEPTELNRSVGIEEWDNTFEQDGVELLVTFNARTRSIEDFFIGGEDVNQIMNFWQLQSDSDRYGIEVVNAIKGPGVTGIKVIPRNGITASVQSPDVRTWTDKSGSFSTDARFGGMANDVVTLHKADGSTVKIKVDQLSEADREWIESRR
jgi:hypothetical protein